MKKEKTFYCSQELFDLIKVVSKEIGYKDTFICEVAVTNFIHLPPSAQRKLIARYHALVAQSLDPDVLKSTDKDIVKLISDAPPRPKKKNTRRSS